MKKITIAIDWLVATGKGTTATLVAKELGYMYLDTGSMYRAVTLYAMRNNLLDSNHADKVAMMDHITLHYAYNTKTEHDDIYLNGENVEKEIRSKKVAMQIYKIANVQGIRDILGALQFAYGKEGWIVADGRDMGTVVFPGAQLKFFLIGDIAIRTKRRYKQKIALWLDASYDDIHREILLRDQEDYLWPNAVNHKADDAIELDTTQHTIASQVAYVVNLAKRIIKG